MLIIRVGAQEYNNMFSFQLIDFELLFVDEFNMKALSVQLQIVRIIIIRRFCCTFCIMDERRK
jgi:hypothetical protein